jgi:hypothetical protein
MSFHPKLNQELNKTLSWISLLIAILCFLSSLAFSIYLELNRPNSAEVGQGFVKYLKVIGSPFYVSQFEYNITQLLSLSYVIFAVVAVILRSSQSKK